MQTLQAEYPRSLASASEIDIQLSLQKHRAGILSWYDYRISTGPLEGTNNKIQTMKRQAYGYRDEEFFRLKIYAAHLTKYSLVG